MARNYNIPIDPNAKCFALIGELAVRWGWIENQTTVFVRVLLRIKKPEGDMAIGNMGIQPKAAVLKSLAQHLLKDGALKKDMIALSDAILDYNKFRNDVIHGLWVHAPKDSDELALLMRKSLQQKIAPHPDKDVVKRLAARVADLRAIQIEAQRLTRELKALRGKFA